MIGREGRVIGRRRNWRAWAIEAEKFLVFPEVEGRGEGRGAA